MAVTYLPLKNTVTLIDRYECQREEEDAEKVEINGIFTMFSQVWGTVFSPRDPGV